MIATLVMAGIFSGVSCQQYLSRSAEISFFSSTPIEDIEAHNTQVSALFDASNGAIAFSVPIRGFHFKKALMEEHFNENYMETESFPSSTIKGSIAGWSEKSEQLFNDGKEHEVVVEGVLNIHGVDITSEFPGIISFNKNSWTLKCDFEVDPIIFEINIPNLVRKQIAEQILISVNATLEPR